MPCMVTLAFCKDSSNSAAVSSCLSLSTLLSTFDWVAASLPSCKFAVVVLATWLEPLLADVWLVPWASTGLEWATPGKMSNSLTNKTSNVTQPSTKSL